MGLRKELRNKTKTAVHEQDCVTALLASTPCTSSFTALKGDHPKPDFQEDYKRFALLRYLFLSFPVSTDEKTYIWLLSVESNCNQPQILLHLDDLDKTFKIRC